MPAYLITAYDISDSDGYSQYSPGSIGIIMATIARHGGEVLAVGPKAAAQWLSESTRDTFVAIQFPSTAAAQGWLDDPDYAPARALREASTTNVIGFIVPAFEPPSA